MKYGNLIKIFISISFFKIPERKKKNRNRHDFIKKNPENKLDFYHHSCDHYRLHETDLFSNEINQSLPKTTGLQSKTHPKKIQGPFSSIKRTQQGNLFKWFFRVNFILKI